MPNVTFTIDDTIAGVGPKKLSFFPREAFATPAGGLVPNDGPKPIKDKSYARGTVHTESLPEGPWWVAGLSPDYIPIDVGPSGGNLKDLIVWGVPQNTPATTLAQAVATWLEANVNTEVSETMIADAISTALAEDETVAGAAAAAVGDAISEADLLQALESVGSADDAAVVFTDADGNRGWLEWNATGGLTNLAKLLICAAIGFWRGPTEPAFPCVWFKTDPTTGELLDILDVTA